MTECIGITTEEGYFLERLGASVRLVEYTPIYDFYPSDIVAINARIGGYDSMKSAYSFNTKPYDKSTELSTLQLNQVIALLKEEWVLYVLTQDGTKVLLKDYVI